MPSDFAGAAQRALERRSLSFTENEDQEGDRLSSTSASALPQCVPAQPVADLTNTFRRVSKHRFCKKSTDSKLEFTFTRQTSYWELHSYRNTCARLAEPEPFLELTQLLTRIRHWQLLAVSKPLLRYFKSPAPVCCVEAHG
ncbi:hypothetical protein DVH05_017187 [Phytophthora capsici]|nr:hypothetical protein DVH05_017187 [Phytophthora capsici]